MASENLRAAPRTGCGREIGEGVLRSQAAGGHLRSGSSRASGRARQSSALPWSCCFLPGYFRACFPPKGSRPSGLGLCNQENETPVEGIQRPRAMLRLCPRWPWAFPRKCPPALFLIAARYLDIVSFLVKSSKRLQTQRSPGTGSYPR